MKKKLVDILGSEHQEEISKLTPRELKIWVKGFLKGKGEQQISQDDIILIFGMIDSMDSEISVKENTAPPTLPFPIQPLFRINRSGMVYYDSTSFPKNVTTVCGGTIFISKDFS